MGGKFGRSGEKLGVSAGFLCLNLPEEREHKQEYKKGEIQGLGLLFMPEAT